MNQHCWYKIKNFPSNILSYGYSFKLPVSTSNNIEIIHSNNFSDELISWGRAREIEFSVIFSFYRANDKVQGTPHIDIRPDGQAPSPGINVEVSGNGIMSFFDVKPVTTTSPVSLLNTDSETTYLHYSYDDIIKIDETDFRSGPRLVRTDIPHDLQVITAPRHVLSIRILTIHGIHPTWDSVTTLLYPDLEPR
jgi:hypothetical protein